MKWGQNSDSTTISESKSAEDEIFHFLMHFIALILKPQIGVIVTLSLPFLLLKCKDTPTRT